MSLEGFFKRPNQNSEPPSGEVAGVHLIDFSQILISTITATYKPTDLITLDMVRHMVINTIRANAVKHKAKYPRIVLCVDNSTGGYWRRKKRWYYKQSRKKSRDKLGFDWEAIYSHMNTIVGEIKENMPYHVLDKEGIEADDHIGVITFMCIENDIPVLITSSDGDFTQLQTSKLVKQWSPQQRKWVKPKHGSPQADLRYKIIKGDKKDCIAPIKADSDHYTHGDGRRAKATKADELALLTNAKREDVESLLTAEQYQRWVENEEMLDFKFIPEEIKSNIITTYENYTPAKRSKLFMYFAAHKLDKLIENMNQF